MARRRKVVDDKQMGFVFTFVKKDDANAEQASKKTDSDASKAGSFESNAEKLKQLQKELMECRVLENDFEKYPCGSEERKELFKRHAKTFESIAKITDPNIFFEHNNEDEERIENGFKRKRADYFSWPRDGSRRTRL